MERPVHRQSETRRVASALIEAGAVGSETGK